MNKNAKLKSKQQKTSLHSEHSMFWTALSCCSRSFKSILIPLHVEITFLVLKYLHDASPEYFASRNVCVYFISEVRRAEGRCACKLELYRSVESWRLCPLIGQEGVVVSVDGGLMSHVVFCDFRGRGSRVQQISGDAACQGRAIQRVKVSLFLIIARNTRAIYKCLWESTDKQRQTRLK